MVAGRVAQSDLVQDEVVGVAQGDHGGDALLLVSDLGLVSEIPPGNVLAEERGAAASVDGALAHDAGVGDAIASDERLAAVAVLGDDAATAGGEIVQAGIARGDQSSVFVDDQGDAGAEVERASEEDVALTVGAQNDGLPLCAVVERILNAGRGDLPLIGGRDDAVIGGDVGLERDAGEGSFRLGDGASVLRAKSESGEEWEQSEKQTQKDGAHGILRGTWTATWKAGGLMRRAKWTDH